MLTVERLTRRFGGLIAVSDVSFEVPDRQVTALIGPNGAGKTTLFNAISGVIPPNEGRVRFNGIDITGWPAHRITKLGLGRTFQNVQLFQNLNALENVAVARYCRSASGLVDALLWRKRDRGDHEPAERSEPDRRSTMFAGSNGSAEQPRNRSDGAHANTNSAANSANVGMNGFCRCKKEAAVRGEIGQPLFSADGKSYCFSRNLVAVTSI